MAEERWRMNEGMKCQANDKAIVTRFEYSKHTSLFTFVWLWEILDMILLHSSIQLYCHIIIIIKFHMLAHLPLLFLLFLQTHSQCLNPCATCLNPYHYPQRSQCLTCVNSYILIYQSCYNCASCSQSNFCDKCNLNGSKLAVTSSSAMIAIICIIAGLFVFSVLIYYLCTRCFKKQQGRVESSHSSRMNQPVNYLRPQGYPVSIEESNINMNQTDKFIRFEFLTFPEITGWAQTNDTINQYQNCAICLDQNVNLQTRCNHLFHSNCLYEWCVRREATCPLCKSASIEPLKIFCSKCMAKSVEVNIFQIPNRIGDKLKICEGCRL